MDTTDQNRVIALVPEDDGAIDNAINDLDAKIAAWVEAMRHASSALAKVARAEVAVPKRTDSVDAPKVAAPQTEAANEAVRPSPSETIATGKTVVALPGGKKKDTPAPVTKVDSDKAPSGLGAKLRKLVGGADAETVEEDAKSVGEAKPAVVESVQKSKQELEDEDEALLAGLDPKLAKSIRIKRRLSRGKKSVRELINESNK